MTVTPRRFALGVAGMWLVAVAAYLVAWPPTIAARDFPDPDDLMRLLEVRDWLAGQAWSDVSQHRLNAPWGAPMHWSRLVDLPIAGVILLLRPLLGTSGAELGALIAVPALTMAAALALVALLGRRLGGPLVGLGCALLLPLTTGAAQQLRPLRIDHHGWQMAIALGLVLALLARDRRGARIAGALAALWLTISLEGLPFCAAAGALLAWRWLSDRADVRLADYAGTLAAVLTLLFALTRGGAAWREIACDAVSPVQLLVVGVAALGAWGAVRLPGRAAVALLALTGAACAALYVGVAPACTRGAFASLDPLVFRFWYANVSEGLPVWRLAPATAALAIGFPLVALAGAVALIRRAEDRRAWIDYALLLLAATIVTALVQRAGAVANVLALPAGVSLMRLALARLDRMPSGVPRVLAIAASLSLLLPPAPARVVQLLFEKPETPDGPGTKSGCAHTRDFAALGAFPPSALMTSIDIGPGILVTTPHRVVASSHHRNVRGLHDAIATFVGPPAQAHAILAARRIDYLVVCPEMAEMDVYRKAAPRGFWAQLAAGRRFAWAERVRLPGSPLAIWRIQPQDP